jgi:2-dehydropantoate 2-reductase
MADIMDHLRIGVVGVGATGAVLAAALLSRYPETVLVVRRPAVAEAMKNQGITVTGEVSYQVPVRHVYDRISMMKAHEPDVVFICTKTFVLGQVVSELQEAVTDRTKIVSAHNGLGTEDVIADAFGAESAFRMSLNYGVSLNGPSEAHVAFFNRPNHLGSVAKSSAGFGRNMADVLSAAGLTTECVDDIKLFVWRKMVMKCTMAPLCAVTDRTLGQLLDFPPTREIADNCFQEILAVAKARGYDLGEEYLRTALGYLEKARGHKDSMCYDVAKKQRTEIDFLGGKVVEYAREAGIATPFYIAMTNMVKTMEDSYLTAESH